MAVILDRQGLPVSPHGGLSGFYLVWAEARIKMEIERLAAVALPPGVFKGVDRAASLAGELFQEEVALPFSAVPVIAVTALLGRIRVENVSRLFRAP